METIRIGGAVERDVKIKAEAAVVASGMSISEYLRRVMAYAANGGDLSIIAARHSGVINGRKTA